ncbi:MAG: hypothetical protein ABSD74_12425 [Rhizomicrobium sp.]|jgi:hypothetical protein
MIKASNGTRKKRAMTLALRVLPDNTEQLFQDPCDALIFNAATLRNNSQQDIRKAVRRVFEAAGGMASDAGRRLVPTVDFRAFSNDLLRVLPDQEFGDEALTSLLFVISTYRARWRAARGNEVWRDGPSFPEYDIAQHPALMRYGNVELRVIEDFLKAPDNLRAAVEKITTKWSSETEMYAPANTSGTLIHDDPDWNLRRLMTNAGFYIGSEPDRAWEILNEWATGYISAICNSNLSWQNTKSLFFPKVQRALYQLSGYVPAYVESPSVRKLYNSIAGKDVLFVSPLAHIVNEQASTGHIWKLYRNYEVPPFTVRAIPAWISTWPNRPHSDWSESFAVLRDSVRAAYRERPFDVFIASCGCYGLPISDFVRSEYGCPTIYLGHQSHKLFGILPVSTDEINPEMWAKSDLGKYENMDRIDKGRYVNAGRSSDD